MGNEGKNLILSSILLCGLSFPVDDGYCEIKIAQQIGRSEPEIHLDRTVAQWEIGYEVNSNFTAFVQHTSGIVTAEEGMGLILIGIGWRFK